MAGEDGDGWIRCDLGHLHWGRFGAAGLLGYARDEAGRTRVLLQRRSQRSSHGCTWGLFGGARRRGEAAAAAALRETAEECTLPADLLRLRAAVRDDHGRWAYDTLIGEMPRPIPVSPLSWETAAAAWVAAAAVAELKLHPGLAAVWPVLVRALDPLVIIVDAANVIGSRADGWWRDRAGAAARLRDQLAVLAERGVTSLPAGVPAPPLDRWFPEIIMVVEGAARSGVAGTGDAAVAGAAGTRSDSAGRDHAGGVGRGAAAAGAPAAGSIRVVAAPGCGDDTIAKLAAERGGMRLVVTADRELRRRCETAGSAVAGPRWLLSQL